MAVVVGGPAYRARFVFGIICTLLLSGCVDSRLRAADGGPAQYSLSQIYEGAKASRSLLKSLRVEYDFTQQVPPRQGLTKPAGPQAAVGTCRRTFVFERERRYLAEAWDRGAGFVTGPTYVFDGDTGFIYDQGSLITRAEKYHQSDNAEYYCEGMIDVPVSDLTRAQYDNSWSYPHCLRPGARKEIVVLPGQEQIDGAWCHVVVCPGVMKWWVDPRLGFAPRRKEQYAEGNPGVADVAPRPLANYSLSSFSEPVNGLWLPMLCECRVYPKDGRSSQPELQQRLEVKSLSVNQATDSDFDLDLPPGTMVLGPGKGFVVKGDKSRLLDIAAGSLDRPAAKPSPLRQLLLVNAALAGLTLTVYAYRRWRSHRRKTVGPSAAAQVPNGDVTLGNV